MDWVPLLEEFWTTFKTQVDDKMENVSRDEAIQARQLGTDEKSGKPITVRMGRYGPFVQIGTREYEDKPRFAGLRPGQIASWFVSLPGDLTQRTLNMVTQKTLSKCHSALTPFTLLHPIY